MRDRDHPAGTDTATGKHVYHCMLLMIAYYAVGRIAFLLCKQIALWKGLFDSLIMSTPAKQMTPCLAGNLQRLE